MAKRVAAPTEQPIIDVIRPDYETLGSANDATARGGVGAGRFARLLSHTPLRLMRYLGYYSPFGSVCRAKIYDPNRTFTGRALTEIAYDSLLST
jgi:hypothetical protein